MRLLPAAIAFLAVSLACGGAPVASTVTTAIPADVVTYHSTAPMKNGIEKAR